MNFKIAISLAMSTLLMACGSLKSSLMHENGSNYSVAQGVKYRGKRVLVSFRHFNDDGSESYSGLWGTVIAVATNGLILKLEGGSEEYDDTWMMPPDLNALKSADKDFYVFQDSVVIEDVDYLAEYDTADTVEAMQTFILKNRR